MGNREARRSLFKAAGGRGEYDRVVDSLAARRQRLGAYPSAQAGCCILEGALIFTVNGEECVVSTGEFTHIPSNDPHAERNYGQVPAFLTIIHPMEMFPHRLTAVRDQPLFLFLCQLEIECAHSSSIDQDRILLELFMQRKNRRLHPGNYGRKALDILQWLAKAEFPVCLVFSRHHGRLGERQAERVIDLAPAVPYEREIKDCPTIDKDLTVDFRGCKKQWHSHRSTNSVS